MELESLSPIRRVEPGGMAEHTDEWYLFDDIAKPPIDEEEIESALQNIAVRAGIELPRVCTKCWKAQG